MRAPKHRFRFLVLVFTVASTCVARGEHSREFTILGREKIHCPVNDDDQPVTVETGDIRVDVIAYEAKPIGVAELAFSRVFGLEIKEPLTVRRILVEEVSSTKPVPVGVDEHPALKGRMWRVSAASIKITSTTPRWLFSPETTWFIYRFTISTVERGEIVIYQAAQYDMSTKAQISGFLAAQKDIRTMLEARTSGNELLGGLKSVITIPVFSAPSPRAYSDLTQALDLAKKQKGGLIVSTENLGWAKELVSGVMRRTKKGRYTGVTLAVIVPGADPAEFRAMAGESGLKIVTSPGAEWDPRVRPLKKENQ